MSCRGSMPRLTTTWPTEPGSVRRYRRGSCSSPPNESRPVASGQDWLKDAGSVPAALLDGNGNMLDD